MTGRWRRALRIPLILLGINLIGGILAAGVVSGYAGSQASLRDRLAAAIDSLNHERATVDEDLAYIEANRAAYEALLARGLVAGQDRLAAARLLERLRDRHGLHVVRYSFSPQREAPLGQGRLAQMTLLTTEVTIGMAGVTDLDLLAFVSSVTDGLSGDVRVVGLSLQRRFDAAPGVLARLRAGERVDLVEGRLQLECAPLAGRPRSSAGVVMMARLMRACCALAATLLVAPASAARAADQAEPALTAAAAEARKAAGDSLLFSKRGERLIEEARLGQGRTPAVAATSRGMQAPAAAPPAVIHLSAIVYHAPDDWRVWLNGQSYTPAAQPRAIEILEVTAGAVRLTWRGGSEKRPRQVELQPNQSYLIASGEIIEGKLRHRLPALPSSPPARGPSR